jgi:hypothetical protein
VPPPLLDADAVFLNIPYDDEFKSLYVAYIVGLYQLKLVPHLTSEITGGARRLDRILSLIKSCRYSIHDLSRVEIDVAPHATPRFNMPLELGMTITWAALHPDRHTWFVWESEPYRLQRSASDLNGTDPNIHHGTPEGILSELRSAFVRDGSPPVPKMIEAYRLVQANMEKILANAGTQNLYAASVFRELRFFALSLAEMKRQEKRSSRP